MRQTRKQFLKTIGLFTAGVMLEGCFGVKPTKQETTATIDGIKVLVLPISAIPKHKEFKLETVGRFSEDNEMDTYMITVDQTSVRNCYGRKIQEGCIEETFIPPITHLISMDGKEAPTITREVNEFTILRDRYLRGHPTYYIAKSMQYPVYNVFAIPSLTKFSIAQSGMPFLAGYRDPPILGSYLSVNLRENNIMSGAVVFVGD